MPILKIDQIFYPLHKISVKYPIRIKKKEVVPLPRKYISRKTPISNYPMPQVFTCS